MAKPETEMFPVGWRGKLLEGYFLPEEQWQKNNPTPWRIFLLKKKSLNNIQLRVCTENHICKLQLLVMEQQDTRVIC